MMGLPLLAAACGLVWAFVFGYLGWLLKRQEKLRREVEALRSMVESQSGCWGKNTQA